jgi:hypothetical protein
VLQGGAALGGTLLAGGCGLFSDGGLLDGSDEPDPDVVALRAAVADEDALLTAYDATLAVHGALVARLQPLRDEHAEHRRVLLDRLGDDAPGVAAGSTPDGQPGPAGGAPAPPPVPGDPAAAAGALRQREDEAARARRRSALRVSGSLAPLLGSVAASEATHPIVLAEAVG